MSRRSLAASVLAVATVVVLALVALAARPDAPDDAVAAPAEFGVLDLQLPDRVVPTTTSTTAAPTTTTTTVAPPPTPTTAAPAPPPPPPTTVAPPPPPPPPAPAGGDEARALQLVNQERANAGLPALQLSSGARSVARTWSAYMAGHGMSHNPDLGGDLTRAGVDWRSIGENVGYGSSVDQVHRAFMGSGGHRANILKADYSQVGIGVVRSGSTVWITMDFVGY